MAEFLLGRCLLKVRRVISTRIRMVSLVFYHQIMESVAYCIGYLYKQS